MQKTITVGPLLIAGLSLLCAGLLPAGCATREKEKVPSALTELKGLHAGVERSEVLQKFGQPVSKKTTKDGTPVEIFEFVESAPAKNATPVSEQTREADTQRNPEVTVVMAQTGPLTDQLAGDRLTVQVIYDEQDLIEDTRLLKVTPAADQR